MAKNDIRPTQAQVNINLKDEDNGFCRVFVDGVDCGLVEDPEGDFKDVLTRMVKAANMHHVKVMVNKWVIQG